MKLIKIITYVLVIVVTTISCRESLPPLGYKYCPKCNGYAPTYDFFNSKCYTCNGTGYVLNDNLFKGIKLPSRSSSVTKDDETEQHSQTDNLQNNTNYTPAYDNYSNTTPYSVVEESVPKPVLCRGCNGSGQCYCSRNGHPGQMLSHYTSSGEPIYITCNHCYGSAKCSGCNGTGYIQ